MHKHTYKSDSNNGSLADEKDRILLDVRRAALFLGLSEDALRARVARRVVPFRRLVGRVVFLRSELEQFVATLPGCSLDEALREVAERKEAQR
jgi:hypothetical protein